MSFNIHISDVICRDEKVKIWMTLINLETYYGNDVTMQETLRGALNENDDQDGILNHLSKMCEDSGKYYVSADLHYTRSNALKRVTSGGIRLRGLEPEQQRNIAAVASRWRRCQI